MHGQDPGDLAGQVAGVRALADSLLLSTAPATYRSLQGWVTTLPAGTDGLKIRRTLDTASLAAAFPFSSPDLPRDPAAPDPLPGVLYGASASGPGLVAWDRWAQDNHNSVTLATSGAGKSPGASWRSPGSSTRAPNAGSSTPKTSTPASPPRSAAPTSTSVRPGCT